MADAEWSASRRGQLMPSGHTAGRARRLARRGRRVRGERLRDLQKSPAGGGRAEGFLHGWASLTRVLASALPEQSKRGKRANQWP